MIPTIGQLLGDPSLFLHGIDIKREQALFYKITKPLPNEHCGIARNYPPITVPLDFLLKQEELINEPIPRPINFIWMTDFCGSTLFAKALNEVPGLYLYNETALFYHLANLKRSIDYGMSSYTYDTWKTLLKISLVFQSKTFATDDVALVKEWPASNYILHEILAMSEDFRGIFMYASLDEYLVTCLKSPDRRKLARIRVEQMFIEIRSIPTLKDINLEYLSDGQVAALHWLYLMYWHHDNNYKKNPKLRTLFNKKFFTDPGQTLRRSSEFFRTTLSTLESNAIVNGSVFTKHSKNKHASFSVKDHELSLDSARQEFAREIDESIDWAQEIISRRALPESPETEL